MPGKNETNMTRYRMLSWVCDWAVTRTPLLERPRTRMFELAQLQPDDRVLVVGVGTGLDLRHLPPTANVIGIDLSAAMLRRSSAHDRNGRYALRQMSAEDLDFSDASFARS